ncbi:unnamed protein product [Schistosoma spindalis]|nr:unnamed protein product [Schistosoma spindale]
MEQVLERYLYHWNGIHLIVIITVGMSSQRDSVTPYDLDEVSLNPSKNNNKTSNHNDSEFLNTGFTLIGYTFLLQIILHIMTFLLNSLSYRYLDTASLGLVNVRLGLFYSTLIFTSREAFRRACLSRGGQVVNKNQLNHCQMQMLLQ